MSGEVLIKVEEVSKKFTSTLRRSMKYGVIDIARSLIGSPSPKDTIRPSEFWAVKDVSFQLKRGECLGIIGPNGSGKSTLLKMLNGIIMPDKGKIEIHGRVGALIEVGAGFHPLLTGRENIYINGLIMGLTRKEIDRNFDSIVGFAELGDFIDTPVSYYSSGMYVRLGFAVAAHLRPDVMIIDEVLAVGDVGFRAKCYKQIASLLKEVAVIFVSHSMPIVNRYCSSVLVLNRGEKLYEGNNYRGIETYFSLFKKEDGREIIANKRNYIKNFALMDKNNGTMDRVKYSSTLCVTLTGAVDPAKKHVVFNVLFLSRDLHIVAACKSDIYSIDNPDGCFSLTVEIAPFILSPGDYRISFQAFDEQVKYHLFWYDAVASLTVVGEAQDYGSAAVRFSGSWKIV